MQRGTKPRLLDSPQARFLGHGTGSAMVEKNKQNGRPIQEVNLPWFGIPGVDPFPMMLNSIPSSSCAKCLPFTSISNQPKKGTGCCIISWKIGRLISQSVLFPPNPANQHPHCQAVRCGLLDPNRSQLVTCLLLGAGMNPSTSLHFSPRGFSSSGASSLGWSCSRVRTSDARPRWSKCRVTSRRRSGFLGGAEAFSRTSRTAGGWVGG